MATLADLAICGSAISFVTLASVALSRFAWALVGSMYLF